MQACAHNAPFCGWHRKAVAFGLQAAARRAHQRLAAEENQQLMMAKAQRNYEEELYEKDVTRHDQQTEVSLRQQKTKLPLASMTFIHSFVHAFTHAFMQFIHLLVTEFVPFACLFMQFLPWVRHVQS